MQELLRVLSQHGYGLLFLFVLAEQLGLPVPALPVLLAVGALAGEGRLSLGWAVVVAVLGAAASDLVWYGLGPYRGRPALHLVCRVTLEPDFCVWRAQHAFLRHGLRALVADLRHSLDLGIEPVKIPGAVRMLPEDLMRRHSEIAAAGDVVLYCSCSNEATGAHMALRLRRVGIHKIRPLAGGLHGWLAAGLPVEPLVAPSTSGADSGQSAASGLARAFELERR
jgi:rhodanese-related sulfurtransferase